MIERERRLQDLEKVNQLETKLHNELKSLRVRVKEMEDDTEKISNVEELKRLAEAQKRVFTNPHPGKCKFFNFWIRRKTLKTNGSFHISTSQSRRL